MKFNLAEHIFIITFSLIVSLWLMFHTFGYNGTNHQILIASRLWSDFSAHIPLIRSFSMGDNLHRLFQGTVEYPIYSGEPIRIHFVFYALVGILENLGMRLDLALNLPSALGFALLLWGVWSLAMMLFKDKRVAVLSILFFLFNGSLAFLKFFSQHPLSLNTPLDILRANAFPAFGPWDGGAITAFWNLNIYTNQRHLALAFAIAIFFMLWCVHHRNHSWRHSGSVAAIWGIAFGALPFLHQPTLLLIAVVLVSYFVLFPKLRGTLLITGLVSIILVIPQLTLLPHATSGGISWYPGYLIHNELSVSRFLWYWFQNLGFHAILIPIGFLFIPHVAKKALVPLFLIFLVANLFTFSIEVAAGHKFFNFVLILGQIISATVLVTLWQNIAVFKTLGLRVFGRLVIVLFVFLLTLSGFIDFFVVRNDQKGLIADSADERVQWILAHTPRDAVFLNSSFLYHPASLAGRSIFLGWPYFSWSAGYQGNRYELMKKMYEAKDPSIFCPILWQYQISYLTVEDTKGDPNLPDIDVAYFSDHFTADYVNPTIPYAIYSTKKLCQLELFNKREI